MTDKAGDKDRYIRVGVNYFKLITKTDRYGNQVSELKAWNTQTIKEDHGSPYLKGIPKYDDFVIVPDHFKYQRSISNNYNLYHEFKHQPKQGSIEWSEVLMNHVFGDQIELGWRYMKLLYMFPSKIAPILVLVSKERETGKTTYLNWINMIYTHNVAMITPDDLTSQFNSYYATKNIIIVEETLMEKTTTVEKLKALSTQKHITINQKHISEYKIPFFGKFILASNNEDNFAKIDQHETRFFIRKLSKPTITNHDIEANLLKEIPALLHHLIHEVPDIDFSVGRVPFTASELANDALSKVVETSKNWLYKELLELFEDYFNESNTAELYVTPKDIKDRWFANNSNAQISYINRVLRDDFGLVREKQMRYESFSEGILSKNGRPYRIDRSMFVSDDSIIYPAEELPF